MHEIAMAFLVGITVGFVLCAWWTIPMLERYREIIGKLEIDLRYARRGDGHE